jgi:hypothetical protein
MSRNGDDELLRSRSLHEAQGSKVWRKVWQLNRKYLLSVGRSGRI